MEVLTLSAHELYERFRRKDLSPVEVAEVYLKRIEDYISSIQYVDVVAASAGFDSYEKDVGKKLTTFDFYLIGRLLKQLAKRMGHHRRFALLEGGYYLPDLGKNVLAFCQGFEEDEVNHLFLFHHSLDGGYLTYEGLARGGRA